VAKKKVNRKNQTKPNTKRRQQQ